MEPYLFANMAEVENHHWWFRGRRRLVEAILDRIDARGDILDVGAGTGMMTSWLQRYGRVVAWEGDPVAAKLLAERVQLPVEPRFLPAPDVPDEQFDLITAFDVLEHIPDDAAAAADICRLLRPGGRFVCTVPAYGWLWSPHDVAHHHQRRYTPAELTALLETAGLHVIHRSHTLVLPFPAYLAQRLWYRVRPPQTSAVSLPPAWLNTVMEEVFSVERLWLSRGGSAPMGASLIAVAERVL